MAHRPFPPRKQRTREHVIADLSINHVERQILLAGHVVERWLHDYGLDLVATTFWSNERGSFIVSNRVTFAQFDAVLDQLGFKKTVIRGSHVNYDHPETGVFLMAQLHKPSDLVPSYVLFGARVELEYQGVIARDDFLKLLEAVAA